MNDLYQPYKTVALTSIVTSALEFDKSLFKKGYQYFFWHMSQVKYFTDHDAALQFYEANEADKYIVKIRVFNINEEYYFWRSADKLTGRLRADMPDANGDVYAIETEMKLRGIVASQIKGADKRNYFLRTRNYIDNDGFGYNDSRFVDITFK